MPSTPTTRFGFVTEADGDALVSAAGRFRTLATAIDSAITGFLSGTAASRPGAAVAGRLYLATDIAGEIAMDTGSAWVSVSPGYGSSLPTTGLYDGQKFIYTADGTNGVRWHLRYNAGGGTYKWESVGGSSALTAEVLTNEVPGTTYGDMTTVGPSITVPLAGDYEIVLSATGSSSSGSNQMLAAPKFGAAAAVDTDAIELFGTGVLQLAISRSLRRNVSSAAMVVKMVYKLPTGGITGSFMRRNLSIKPIRVA
jgi:hypothetical protein